MSRFFSDKYRELNPYVPGEQPGDQPYIKLNTNESPFAPSETVLNAVRQEAGRLQLYPDPECRVLRELLADRLDVRPEELVMTNGSDEILNFAFMAFCDEKTPALFPDITYGFYRVYGAVNRVPFREIPLGKDWRIHPEDYVKEHGTAFIANPNAPTGIAMDRDQIEWLLQNRQNDVLVVDEAYVDFGAESCIPLIHKYDQLLVCRTFSKSRSLAGARLGFGAGNKALIRDLNTIKFSTNPYTVNRMTAAAGIACLQDDEVNQNHCREIAETREWTADELRSMGFEMTDSRTNFLFVRHPAIEGEVLYQALKKRGILIRHFSQETIKDWNRITIGTRKQMRTLTDTIREILSVRQKGANI